MQEQLRYFRRIIKSIEVTFQSAGYFTVTKFMLKDFEHFVFNL
jgi:hypothetical protein